MESECRQRATARQLSLITQIPMLSRYSRQREQSLTVIVGVASTMRESGVANSEWRVANREEKRPAIRYSLLASATSTRPLIEQNRAHVRVLHAHSTGLL